MATEAACDDAVESIDEVRTDWPNTLERSGDATIDDDGADNPIVVPIGCDKPPADWALYLMKYTSGLLGGATGALAMAFVNSSIESGFFTST